METISRIAVNTDRIDIVPSHSLAKLRNFMQCFGKKLIKLNHGKSHSNGEYRTRDTFIAIKNPPSNPYLTIHSKFNIIYG